MPECPTCGKSLTSERGVRQHHTKVHADPLPNRTCEDCVTEFYDPKARLSYCDDCDPNAGENNGNWRDATELTECERCSDEFEYYPSDKTGVYCPDCVREADEFLGDHYAEVHDIERVQRECECCGTQFSVLPCVVRDGGVRFCSRDCVRDTLYSGRSRPDAYSGDWYRVRRQALDRDDHRCQYCGKKRAEIGREPDVHHSPLFVSTTTRRKHTLSTTSSHSVAVATDTPSTVKFHPKSFNQSDRRAMPERIK